jgi:CubicO group peptidase (beta-lactamase class C family)
MSVTASASPMRTDHDLDMVGLVEIECLFRGQLSPLRLHPGAALAVYYRGALIVDLTAGWADTQSGEGVTADTLFPLFSGTKPLVSVALLQQIERGRASLDDPVAAYWPEFGRNGKATITLRQILTHRGGIPATPVDLPPASWSDLDAVLEAIAMMAPSITPGAVSAYHFLTQQWVCAEIVRRLDGRLIQDYLREEITGPLGMMDTYLGLPPDQEGRLVKLHVTDGTDSWGIETLRNVRDSRFHRMVVPGGSAVSTARDICRFYAAIAAGGTLDGMRIVRPETVDLMMNIEVDGETDPTFDVPVRRGLGFELGGLEDRRRHGPGATSTAHTFWHGGFGTSVCWGDRELDLSMAFTTNGIRRDEAGAIARRDLSDAVRALGR